MDEELVRQNLLLAAVDFLQNPKLIDSPLKEKLKFLQEKGLNQLEIDEAINSALSVRHSINNKPSGRWNLLLVMALAYGGYYLYKAYAEQRATQLENEITSQLHKQKPLTLQDIMTKMNEIQKLIETHRLEFKAEIRSIRSLMLGHEKFSSPPTIPSWQLSDDKIEQSSSKEKTTIPQLQTASLTK